MATIKQYRFLLQMKFFDLLMMRLLPIASFCLFVASQLFFWNKDRSLGLLLAARRAYPYRFLDGMVRRRIVELRDYAKRQYTSGGPVRARFIQLKFPRFHNGEIEKGVILIKFSEHMLPFFCKMNVKLLSKYYHIVLEPSWAGYAEASILVWSDESYGKVFVCCPDAQDYDFVRSLEVNLEPIALGASDWVDDQVFMPLPEVQKIYGAVCVANYNPIKRLHRLFRALATMGDPTFKVGIVCSAWVGDRESVLSLADYYNVRDKFDLYENLTQSEINEVLNKGKVNLLLSLREGANKTIFEGLFANTPCIVLKENVGVNKSHVNDLTGKLINDCDLEGELSWFSGHWEQFRAREWAEQNISPRVSASRLGEYIKPFSRDTKGKELWSRDLYAKVNAPELAYHGVANANGIQEEMNGEFIQMFAADGGLDSMLDMDAFSHKILEYCEKWQARLISKHA